MSKKKKKKVSKLQLDCFQQILSSAVKFSQIKKLTLQPSNYFVVNPQADLRGCCLLGAVILKFLDDHQMSWIDYQNRNIYCFELARQILNCSKDKLRMIILGFDESFELSKPRLKNDCYQLGFSYGKKK